MLPAPATSDAIRKRILTLLQQHLKTGQGICTDRSLRYSAEARYVYYYYMCLP